MRKLGRRMPIAVLLLGNYARDLQAVRSGVAEALPRLPESWARSASCAAALGVSKHGLRINTAPYWPWRNQLFEGKDAARDITDAVRARLPAGDWGQDLASQFESGADMRPLYELLSRDLAPLEEYEVQLRGLVR